MEGVTTSDTKDASTPCPSPSTTSAPASSVPATLPKPQLSKQMEGIITSDTKDTSTPCLSPSTVSAPASAAAATLPKPQRTPPSNLPSEGMVSPQTNTPLIGANATTPSPSTTNNTARNNHNSASAEAPKSLRGLNKPKCSECGNVARSRCPFQACKSCCVKARNPCHIHGGHLD